MKKQTENKVNKLIALRISHDLYCELIKELEYFDTQNLSQYIRILIQKRGPTVTQLKKEFAKINLYGKQ